MKKGIAAALALLLALGVCVPAFAGARPLLYRVEDQDGHTVYLLGTIHVGRESTYPLSEAVEKAYREADVLAVELDVSRYQGNPLLALRYSFQLIYGLGDGADRHLSEEAYRLGVEKLGQPEWMLKKMRPAVWLSLAENTLYEAAGLSSELGVDMHLLQKAHGDGKQIAELEGAEDQFRVLMDMPDEVVDQQLKQILNYPVLGGLQMRMLMDAWEKGEEATLSLFLASDASQAPPEARDAYEAYLKLMYDDRNDGFEQAARDFLARGETALIAVGTAHIVGPGALADRLAKAGYRVTEIGR